MDESVTGSANFLALFGSTGRAPSLGPRYDHCVHLRMPSLDRGLVSGLWAIGLGLFLLVGMLTLGVDKGTAFIVSPIAAAAIFFYVRIFGEERPR